MPQSPHRATKLPLNHTICIIGHTHVSQININWKSSFQNSLQCTLRLAAEGLRLLRSCCNFASRFCRSACSSCNQKQTDAQPFCDNFSSRRPIWSDMTPVDTITPWREDLSSASVVNHTIVTDPTIRQPGFDLSRHTWSLMNRFRTGQGPCCVNLHKWGLTQSPSCVFDQRQTMNHIVNTLSKFEGGQNLLHEADDESHMSGICSNCSTRKMIIPQVHTPKSIKICEMSRINAMTESMTKSKFTTTYESEKN